MLKNHNLSASDLSFDPPSFRTLLAIIIFLLASGFQYDCHNYLAYLKTSKSEDGKDKEGEYKLPTHPAFQPLIAPHYMAECMIYLSFVIVAAPRGYWVNWTMTSVLCFVVVNLGVTAEGTRRWYIAKFGEEAVREKWRMIPGVF